MSFLKSLRPTNSLAPPKRSRKESLARLKAVEVRLEEALADHEIALEYNAEAAESAKRALDSIRPAS